MLAHVGPADVALSTWTANRQEALELAEMHKAGTIRGMRWLVDLTFVRRDPEAAHAVRQMFGVDAIRIANDCAFGLQASCFTRDLGTAYRMARELEAGSVWINEGSRFRLDSYPFGGFGKSGSGREGVKYAMDEMTTWKFLGIRLPSQGAMGA